MFSEKWITIHCILLIQISFFGKNKKVHISFSSFINKDCEEYTNSQKEFSNNFFNRFHLFFSSEDKRFINNWEELSSQRMQDIVTIHTGVRSKLGQKRIVSERKESVTWKRGIISSSQVKQFNLDYKGHWLNIDPSILWSGGFDRSINENPKLIIRQTGYNIISCVDLEGYYHLNNCHSISPKEKDLNLFALSVVLNSNEFNRMYQILSIEKGRALAQIDIEFLLKMSIPSLNEENNEKLEEFYFTKNQATKKESSVISFSLFELIEKT